MTFPKARVVVSLCLFLAWIGFLLFLVIDSPKLVISQPQFRTASLWVVAEVGEDSGWPNPRITVTDVLWRTAQKEPQNLVGQRLTIPILVECRKAQGFVGPGKYILPLVEYPRPEMTSKFELAPIPRVQGYPEPVMTLGKVLITDAGAHPDKVTAALISKAKWDKDEAESHLAALSKRTISEIVVVNRRPKIEIYPLVKLFKDLGARCEWHPEDVRIYPATAQALAEVQDLLK
jgi:hypothetical protein